MLPAGQKKRFLHGILYDPHLKGKGGSKRIETT